MRVKGKGVISTLYVTRTLGGQPSGRAASSASAGSGLPSLARIAPEPRPAELLPLSQDDQASSTHLSLPFSSSAFYHSLSIAAASVAPADGGRHVFRRGKEREQDGQPVPPDDETYLDSRYADLWLLARLRGIYEPCAAAVVCMWVAWTVPGAALRHLTDAAVFGALLVLSFFTAAALLAWGILWPGSRRPSRRLPWWASQTLEMLPTLLNSAVVIHWARIIGCLLNTPVFAICYEMGFAASSIHVLDPYFALGLQLVIAAHLFGAIGYEATHTAHWPPRTSSLWWIEYFFTGGGMVSVQLLVIFVGAIQIEALRRGRHSNLTIARREKEQAVSLASQFLPAPVVRLMSVHSRTDVLAWQLYGVCILQADIVGCAAAYMYQAAFISLVSLHTPCVPSNSPPFLRLAPPTHFPSSPYVPGLLPFPPAFPLETSSPSCIAYFLPSTTYAINSLSQKLAQRAIHSFALPASYRATRAGAGRIMPPPSPVLLSR